MNSGIYTAFSGLKAQMDALDIASNNLANVNTVGFKEQKPFFSVLDQAMNSADSELGAVINRSVLVSETWSPLEGSMVATQRDLDLALNGEGFLSVQTPGGTRYTRNGNLSINQKAELSTHDGLPILGENGPIVLGPGKIHISEEGDVFLNDNRVDRLKLVAFEGTTQLVKEGNSLLVSRGDAPGKPAQVSVREGYLEQSNVNAITSVIGLVGIMRHFEAIQKSFTMMNDMNAKAIEKLSR